MPNAKERTFRPFLLGSGGAALAIEGALGLLRLARPAWTIAPAVRLRRDCALAELEVDADTDFLCIANPHALHADRVVEAAAAGFRRIVTEKPLATSLRQLETLRRVPADVAVGVFHGYRALWGPREIRRRIGAGELGRVFAVEGRYWQSSAAQVGVGEKPARGGWKDDVALSGPYDVALDLGTHWVDLAASFAGAPLEDGVVRRHYVHAEALHRDTHVTLDLAFGGGVRSVASVSKVAHGAVNDLDVVVLGTLGRAQWSFARPDELVLARGSETRRLVRPPAVATASRLPVGHGLGWLDGYAAVLDGFLERWGQEPAEAYPSIHDCLPTLERYLRLLER
jgi:predicted dehydrogenase